MIAACKDDQVTADGADGGLCATALCEALGGWESPTHLEVLNSMREHSAKIQLSTNFAMDLDTPFVL